MKTLEILRITARVSLTMLMIETWLIVREPFSTKMLKFKQCISLNLKG